MKFSNFLYSFSICSGFYFFPCITINQKEGCIQLEYRVLRWQRWQWQTMRCILAACLNLPKVFLLNCSPDSCLGLVRWETSNLEMEHFRFDYSCSVSAWLCLFAELKKSPFPSACTVLALCWWLMSATVSSEPFMKLFPSKWGHLAKMNYLNCPPHSDGNESERPHVQNKSPDLSEQHSPGERWRWELLVISSVSKEERWFLSDSMAMHKQAHAGTCKRPRRRSHLIGVSVSRLTVFYLSPENAKLHSVPSGLDF